MDIYNDLCHEEILKNITPLLAFQQDCDYLSWKENVKNKLCELLGDMPEKCDLNIKKGAAIEFDDFTERRIIFSSEKNVEVPCHLWIPKNVKLPCPVVICLQGHTTGMHISMGRAVYPGDEKLISGGDRDFAKQIIKNGYAALVVEQRGFGERKSEANLRFNPEATCTCWHNALTALLIGRTLIGERVWDVSRAIDVLETIPDIDSKKIGLMGHSGGGTASYYAACLDERINIVMPSGAICTFAESIAKKRHCMCNYIPGMAKYFDMGDLACLIAPRPIVMVSGVKDPGFLFEGAQEAYERIESIYEKANAKGKSRFVAGAEGHRFYADLSWPVFNELCGWND